LREKMRRSIKAQMGGEMVIFLKKNEENLSLVIKVTKTLKLKTLYLSYQRKNIF
jgi:hypothetical protein